MFFDSMNIAIMIGAAVAGMVLPGGIGIGGFSAGGAVTMGPVFEHDAESRPDFAVGIYPAYRAGLPLPPDAPPLFLEMKPTKAVAASTGSRSMISRRP